MFHFAQYRSLSCTFVSFRYQCSLSVSHSLFTFPPSSTFFLHTFSFYLYLSFPRSLALFFSMPSLPGLLATFWTPPPPSPPPLISIFPSSAPTCPHLLIRPPSAPSLLPTPLSSSLLCLSTLPESTLPGCCNCWQCRRVRESAVRGVGAIPHFVPRHPYERWCRRSSLPVNFSEVWARAHVYQSSFLSSPYSSPLLSVFLLSFPHIYLSLYRSLVRSLYGAGSKVSTEQR